MTGHTDELFVLESHPIDPHVLVSAGHDGQLFIWDIMEGQSIAKFVNHIDGQGNGGIFDAKWSPDGSMIAATDSHGHILMYGFGSGHPRLKMVSFSLQNISHFWCVSTNRLVRPHSATKRIILSH